MVDRYQLLEVAGDLDWPAVELGQLQITGEDSWRWALVGFPGAVPAERRALLVALKPYLLRASEPARVRLAAWEARPARPPESPEALRARLRDDLCYYGDVEMLPAIVEAFIAAPAPVRDVLSEEAAIVGVGWSTNGWCAPAIGTGPAGQRPTRLIVLTGSSRDGEQVTHTCRHELAHGWFTPMPGPHSQTATARGTALGFALAREEHWACLPRVEAAHAREERLAQACALAWKPDR